MNAQLSMQAAYMIHDKTGAFVLRLATKDNQDKNTREIELLEWRSPFYLGSWALYNYKDGVIKESIGLSPKMTGSLVAKYFHFLGKSTLKAMLWLKVYTCPN